jgi:hypothetical protein
MADQIFKELESQELEDTIDKREDKREDKTEEKTENKTEKKTEIKAEIKAENKIENGNVTTDNIDTIPEEAGWTVKDTKTRRLAPSFTLSRKDMGSSESPKKSAAIPESAPTKKKGII